MDGRPPPEYRALMVGVQGPAPDLTGDGVFHRLLPAHAGWGVRPVRAVPAGPLPLGQRGPAGVAYFDGVDLDLQESVRLFGFHRVAGCLRGPALAAVLDPHVPRA